MIEIPKEIMLEINEAASHEQIYEPKYGGKDHSGYDTMMKYEINYERSECFEKGAIFGYSLAAKELEEKGKEIAKIKESLAIAKVCWKEEMTDRMEKEKEIERLTTILNMGQKEGRI